MRGSRAGMLTTTVVDVQHLATGRRQTWIAVESAGPMPKQWLGKLRRNERFVAGLGHAEETIVSALGKEWSIVQGGVSRGVCWGVCEPMLSRLGLILGGKRFRSKGWNSPYRMFWRVP